MCRREITRAGSEAEAVTCTRGDMMVGLDVEDEAGGGVGDDYY